MPSLFSQPSRYQAALLTGLLLLLTAIAYSPVSHCGFIWDDNDYVTENQTLRDGQGLRDIWLKPSATPQYYPLVHSTFWLEYQLWELNPLGYHLTNVSLHAINALLLWYLLTQLQIPGAWLAAMLFAVHPVEVESVAWVTERKNVLSGAFYLTSLIAFWKFWQATSPGFDAGNEPRVSRLSPVQWLVISYLCFVGALLSKTVTATLPAVILVLIWWKTGRIGWRDCLRLLPMFVLGISLGLLTVWLEKHQVGASGADWDFTPWQRCLIAGKALWFYAAKLVWPTNLAFIYPRWDIPGSPAWHAVFPLSLLALMIGLWLMSHRIGRGPAAALFIFAGTLFPALGFFDVYPMRFSLVADHFQYLASIALIVLGAAAMVTLATRWLQDAAWARHLALVGGLGTLMLLTWNQVQIYRDLDTLWNDTLNKNPECFLAHNNLGAIKNRRGLYGEAQLHLREAIRIKPDFLDALVNLGKSKEGLQDFSGATEYYRRAYEINPDYAPALNGLGAMMGAQGDLDAAEKLFRHAIEVAPQYASARLNLASIQESRGDIAGAIETLQVDVPRGRESQPLIAKRITIYLQAGRLGEAKQLIQQQLEDDPTNPELIGGLGIIALQQDLPREAIRHFERVLELAPQETNAIYGLMMAHRAAGSEADALKYEKLLSELSGQK